MNGSVALPLVGTLLLAGGASCLGYLFFTGEAVKLQNEDVGVVLIATDIPLQSSRRPVLPSVRPDAYYQAITQRPIFDPTRRPFTETPASETMVESSPDLQANIALVPPENLTLSGVLGAGRNRSALVAWAGGRSDWVRVGQAIEGWVVTEIESEWITLTAGEDRFRLELFE